MSFPFLEPKVLVELLLSSSGHATLASVPVGLQIEQLHQVIRENNHKKHYRKGSFVAIFRAS